MTKPSYVFVADWSKNVGKRVTYRIDVERRCVTRLDPPAGGWTVEGLVIAASQLSSSVMVLIDVAIGLPRGLFEAVRDACGRTDIRHFLDLLRARPRVECLGDVNRHQDWSIRKPYIHVPAGDGSLARFREQAAGSGVCLERAIDLKTGGRSPLILSGIPGTVGSGSRNVIQSLGELDPKKVAIWPFDGPLTELLASKGVVLGEIYPRALYGHALLDETSAQRCRVAVGKTKPEIRAAAIAHLEGLQWHLKHNLDVMLDDELRQRARNDEDDFDAFLSALGILRLLLENVSLEDETLRQEDEQRRPRLLDDSAEGGMLGLLATQLQLNQCVFGAPQRANAPVQARNEQGPLNGQWVRVTNAVLANAARHQNNRQISFSGLPAGTKDTPVWVEIECQGRSYTLTIEDTNTCFGGHQIATAEDFDALYNLLSGNPDTRFPVILIEDRPRADMDLAEGD